MSAITPVDEKNAKVAHFENVDNNHLVEEIDTALAKGQPVQMRSSLDNISVWQAVKVYKRASLVCFLAAFSASLDGYQINLNGGIVSNKGFIRQMASPGTKIINAKYVSAWGGIQSAGQFLGQVFLQFATEALGRKVALYIMWIVCVLSILTESLAKNWWAWLIAKLLSGVGVGMMQATLPLYISELAPTQLRGMLINAYTLWFVVGQLMAAVSLRELNAIDPYAFRTAIFTQWGMIGALILILVFLPESPWWLVSKGKLDRAEKILRKYHGHIQGYNVHEELAIMTATIETSREQALASSGTSLISSFRGTNGFRLLIACWPKVIQQFVGLTVFNTYSTYFFQLAGNKNPFTVTVILACVQLLSTLAVMGTTDSLGRRPLTVYGYAVTCLADLGMGIVGCFDYTSSRLGSLLIFFACLATFSTSGASAIGYAYLAEVPPQQLRARIAGWGLAFSNLWGIMFSFCTPLMLNGKAKWNVKTGFFFAATGTVTTAVGWLILPEVARRTPAEIDEMFEKKISPRKFGSYKTDVQLYLEEKERVEGMVHA